jgi:acetate kinase
MVAPLPARPILVLNAGSATLKFSVFPDDDSLAPSVHGLVDAIGIAPTLSVADAEPVHVDAGDHRGALATVAAWLERGLGATRPVAVGHRIVHGGWHYRGPVLVDDRVLRTLDALVPLAPLHQPQEVAAVRAVAEQWRGVPQVACFDTAFHAGRPAVAETFALPRELYERGVRRYGFHGLSYEYIADALPAVAPAISDGSVVVAHLGNGASLCAMRGRRSVDTTMTFSALDGLPMGTRAGSLDPAAVLYLVTTAGMRPDDVTDLLYRRSGLLGLSGVSSDVRQLLASEEPRARFALEYFTYRIACAVGGLASALGGLDGLVFTAGIGEHAAPIRADVCRRLAWLGTTLDDAANARHGPLISTKGSPIAVYVIPTNEEVMIARHTRRLACQSS